MKIENSEVLIDSFTDKPLSFSDCLNLSSQSSDFDNDYNNDSLS